MKTKILNEDSPPVHLTPGQMEELLNHSSSRLVWGEGNPSAPLFIILDNPGAREDKEGKEYLCGTRETLQLGLLDVGINLDDIYVSYLLKSRPLKKYDKELARSISLNYLIEQVKMHRPQLVLCLGDVVVKAYFKKPTTSVKELRGQYYTLYGVKTVVSYHPLAVRRRPNLAGVFKEDLDLIAKALTSSNH